MGENNPFYDENANLESLLISRDNNHVATEIDGELVLLDLASNSYLGFDPVGSSIWQLLETPITFRDLLIALVEKYDVMEDVCRADTISFLHDLAEKNLLIFDSK